MSARWTDAITSDHVVRRRWHRHNPLERIPPCRRSSRNASGGIAAARLVAHSAVPAPLRAPHDGDRVLVDHVVGLPSRVAPHREDRHRRAAPRRRPARHRDVGTGGRRAGRARHRHGLRPALPARRRGDGARDAPARRPLRAPATARRRVPRPMAVRSAAVARHHRPRDRPTVHRLRRGVLRAHRHPGRGDLRHPADAARRPRVAHVRRDDSGAPALPALRARLPRVVRDIQDQTGDLTTTIEEGARGIRVLKAFGRWGEAYDAYNAQSTKLYDTQIKRDQAAHQVRVGARHHPEPHADRRAAGRRHRRGRAG